MGQILRYAGCWADLGAFDGSSGLPNQRADSALCLVDVVGKQGVWSPGMINGYPANSCVNISSLT